MGSVSARLEYLGLNGDLSNSLLGRALKLENCSCSCLRSSAIWRSNLHEQRWMVRAVEIAAPRRGRSLVRRAVEVEVETVASIAAAVTPPSWYSYSSVSRAAA